MYSKIVIKCSCVTVCWGCEDHHCAVRPGCLGSSDIKTMGIRCLPSNAALLTQCCGVKVMELLYGISGDAVEAGKAECYGTRGGKEICGSVILASKQG